MIIYFLILLALIWLGLLTWYMVNIFAILPKKPSARMNFPGWSIYVDKNIRELNQKMNQLELSVEHQKKDALSTIRKIGLYPFYPFGLESGIQSFVLCLLDKTNRGILITSICADGQTRTYSKMVNTELIKKDLFSKEEVAAFQLALKNE